MHGLFQVTGILLIDRLLQIDSQDPFCPDVFCFFVWVGTAAADLSLISGSLFYACVCGPVVRCSVIGFSLALGIYFL